MQFKTWGLGIIVALLTELTPAIAAQPASPLFAPLDQATTSQLPAGYADLLTKAQQLM
ncbi:MAG: hypothetical protein F6K04_04495, partial [Leptolyngbya sp. SIO4C5]|nr:hypothetical protein [Leptolyngbya sp. SIO4C5]